MAIEAISSSSSVYQPISSEAVAVKTDTEATKVATPSKMENNNNNNQMEKKSDSAKEQGRYEVENADQVSPDKVKKAVNEINQKIRPTHTSCQFSYHEKTNRITIKVIDDDTEEVIREIPPEKALDMLAKTLELEGILVDERR